MQIGRKPTPQELTELLRGENDIEDKKAAAQKELAFMRPGEWLIYEAATGLDAFFGSLAITALLPSKGKFDIKTSGDKTFVHRLK